MSAQLDLKRMVIEPIHYTFVNYERHIMTRKTISNSIPPAS